MVHRSLFSLRAVIAVASVVAAMAILIGPTASAQIPAGYYNSVDASNSTTLRATLHGVIDDHTKLPYTSSGTDTWDCLELADEDPNNAGRILDVYKNESYAKQGGGNSFYQREHSWPKSFGFPNDGFDNLPYSDCHLLFLSDGPYNFARSNKPFRDCVTGCTEYATSVNNGKGGPGQSNWTFGQFSTGGWEVWSGRRGDLARAMFYADIRYEGGTHSILNVSEPDLRLTDSTSLIDSSNTGNNESVGYMGILSVLLQWHIQDPVDADEMQRNDVVMNFQGNRNPFVDHPEWAACLFQGACSGDVTPPAIPTGLMATAGNGFVLLDWQDNNEQDLAGYRVYRSQGGAFTQISGGVLSGSGYNDLSVSNGTTYLYQVTAEDVIGNESSPSGTVQATPQLGGGGLTIPWINELHYDNASTDVGEFVEIAGAAGTDLSGYTLVAYNGSGGASYMTTNLAGLIPNLQGGFGTLSFATPSLQNGPDGVALVDNQGGVIEFLSYEGSFQAINGPASGMTSTDIQVSESSSTLAGESLQLGGLGTKASDFFWQSESAETPALINNNQTLGSPGDTTPPAAPSGLVATATPTQVFLDWSDNGEGDLQGYDVYRATISGGPYAKLTPVTIASSLFIDAAVIAGVSYHYVVTASDLSGNESANSGEAHANPVLCQPDLGFGSHPTAALSICGGDLSTGHDATLALTGLPAAGQLLLFVGLTSTPTPIYELGGASLVPVPPLFVLSLPNPGTGTLALPVPGGGASITLYLQGIVATAQGADTTNAVQLNLLP